MSVGAAPLLFLFMISGCGLAYELILLRLFSQIQWHHFSYLAISIALLGHGAAGAWLAIVQQRWLARGDFWLYVNGLGFAFTAMLAFVLVQQLPFNSLEILWDPRQWLWLALLYLCLFVPFFFGAVCQVLAIRIYTDAIGQLYAASLIGAGVGALLVVLLQFYFSAMQLLLGLSLTISLSVCLLMLRQGASGKNWLAAGLCIVFVFLLPSELQPSPFKALSKQLTIPQSRILHERHSPYGNLQVVESGYLPFRNASGLSLLNPHVLPQQLGLYVDGDGPQPINRWQGRKSISHLDQQTNALAYHLLRTPAQATVLLMGMAGGAGLQQAHWYQVKHADVVELNGQKIELLTDELAQYWGWPALSPQADIYHSDARAFVEQLKHKYDLIQLPLNAANTMGSGTQGIAANYLFTRQALRALWLSLSPEGMLSITVPLDLPPRIAMKLLVSVSELLSFDVTQPEQHLLLVRNWNAVTLLLAKSIFSARQYQTAQQFSEARAFDLQAFNTTSKRVYNRLPEDYFGHALSQLFSPQRDEFIEHYKFDIRAASDDKPYFFHFFRWQYLPEFYALYQQGGLALIEQAYPLLWGLLILSIILSVGLIILPLLWLHRGSSAPKKMNSLPWLGYFLLLGLGFMLVEMALIPGFIRFLSHPGLSFMVVVAALLVFAGAGSYLSTRYWVFLGRRKGMLAATLGLIIVFYHFLLPWVFTIAAGWPLPWKLLSSVLLLLPLGLLMGMPMPLGLKSLDKQQPSWLPWAWGVNGCASVISTSLATLLAVHFGHSQVLLLAALCYGLIAWLCRAENTLGL